MAFRLLDEKYLGCVVDFFRKKTTSSMIDCQVPCPFIYSQLNSDDFFFVPLSKYTKFVIASAETKFLL